MASDTKYYIFINSYLDRTQNDNNQTDRWTTYLSKPLKADNPKAKFLTKVDYIEIPNTSYNISSYESVFHYENITAGTFHSIPLDTNRIYNDGSELATALNTAFTSNTAPLSIQYNAQTAKMTITNTSVSDTIRIVGSFRWSDNIDKAYRNIIDRLGLVQNFLVQPPLSPGQFTTGEGIIRLNRSNCYYLVCDEISNSNVIPSPFYQNSTRIIARIPAGSFGSISQFSLINDNSYVIEKPEITEFNFQLLDDAFQPVDINDVPITMLLEIQIKI